MTKSHKVVNFLDVDFNLETGLYRPYMKPNDTPTYVHKDSNHPKSILNNIPLSVNRRLSSISANEDVFNSAIPPYQEALRKSGYASRTFKQRFYGHSHSFNNRDSTTSTTLSSYIWDLKDQDRDFNLSWNVIDRGKAFNPVTRKCNLCVKEKFHIIFQPEGASLNKRSELFSTCRHRKKDLLCNLD